MWSAGCIFIELLTRQSPFPGKTEKQQMELIFKTCGTPTEKNWEGVANLEGYKKFVKGKMIVYTNRLREVFSGKVEPLALDLICKLLALDPAKRITASDALDHDYFWKDCPPCQPAELPIYRSMHEFEAKKKRIERQAKRQKVNGYEIPDMYSRGPMSHQPPYPPRTNSHQLPRPHYGPRNSRYPPRPPVPGEYSLRNQYRNRGGSHYPSRRMDNAGPGWRFDGNGHSEYPRSNQKSGRPPKPRAISRESVVNILDKRMANGKRKRVDP